MQPTQRIVSAASLAFAAFVPVVLFAHSYGPPPGVTAAPGDDPRACTACHAGTAVNAGGGKVEIVLPGDATYTPGIAQHVMVRVTDDPQRRWGFQFSPRLASDAANQAAGTLASTTSLTQVYCNNYTPTATGTPTACPAGAIQFISHVTAGTRAGTAGPTLFEFDWTPPATDQGPVTLYVAANASNNNGSPSGDHIYTANVTLAVSTPQKPVVKSNGIVSAASAVAAPVTQNSWISIYGNNLSSSTRTWGSADIKNGALPTSLDGVKVTINGKSAYVEYISPTQINVLTPDETATGPVQVQVTTLGGQADPATITLQGAAPAFFTFDGKFLAATHVDGSLIGAPGFFPGAPNATTPAKSGETIVLYGTGFGPTNPPATAGQVVAQLSLLAAKDLSITVGGVPAIASFAGLIPGAAGLYQFNVQLPAAIPDGDQKVIASVGGVASVATSITVRN